MKSTNSNPNECAAIEIIQHTFHTIKKRVKKNKRRRGICESLGLLYSRDTNILVQQTDFPFENSDYRSSESFTARVKIIREQRGNTRLLFKCAHPAILFFQWHCCTATWPYNTMRVSINYRQLLFHLAHSGVRYSVVDSDRRYDNKQTSDVILIPFCHLN